MHTCVPGHKNFVVYAVHVSFSVPGHKIMFIIFFHRKETQKVESKVLLLRRAKRISL